MMETKRARNERVHSEKLKNDVFIFEEETDPESEKRAMKLIKNAAESLKGRALKMSALTLGVSHQPLKKRAHLHFIKTHTSIVNNI